MPKVKGKKFPYTKAGKKAAKKEMKKVEKKVVKKEKKFNAKAFESAKKKVFGMSK